MNKNKRVKLNAAQTAIAAAAMVISFAVTLQVKSVQRNISLAAPNMQRIESLTAELMKEKDKSDNLYRQLIEYKNDLDEFKNLSNQNSDFSGILAKQLKDAEIAAGLVEVSGPGIVFKMDDSKVKPNTSSGFANYYLVHDSDILMAINELRDAGAEAISINGERLLATSEVRCAGSVLSVNNNRYSAPYEIRAIGEPDKLESALSLRGGVIETLKLSEIETSIKKSSSVTVPGYSGAVTFKYAVPSDGKNGGGGL